jgi:tetratricopeptide (TPR) repeat protein
VLRAFRDDHPEPAHHDLADVHYKLARLLAGPLEDVHGAIECYERALEIAPNHGRAREPLASLLVHLPERWKDAIRHHAQLLRDEPTRSASIRALQQIADRRGHEQASLFGLAILRALGSASPSERAQAPEVLEAPIRGARELLDPIWEMARQLAEDSAELLERVLEDADEESTSSSGSDDGFTAAVTRIEHSLCPPALSRLRNEEVSDLLCTIADVAVGEDSGRPPRVDEEVDEEQSELATAIHYALGRRTRRKLRRTLDGTTPELMRTIDLDAWRAAIRGMAAARALEDSPQTLRRALLELSIEPGETSTTETDDLSARMAGSEAACDLLRQLEAAWCNELMRD